jgi:putative oxidoreductase
MFIPLDSLKQYLYPSGFPGVPASLALLALRVFLGLAFVQHGLGKWHDIPGFAEEFSIPAWMAMSAAASQILAAIILIPGFASPLAAVTIGGNMVVAVVKLIGRGESFVNPHGHSWEAAGFYAVLGTSLYLLGPGRFSMDSIVMEKWLRRS